MPESHLTPEQGPSAGLNGPQGASNGESGGQGLPAPENAPRGHAGSRADSDAHEYLSTGCLHGEHAYCQGKTGMAGAKKPGVCKFCDAACQCPCHARAIPVEPAAT